MKTHYTPATTATSGLARISLFHRHRERLRRAGLSIERTEKATGVDLYDAAPGHSRRYRLRRVVRAKFSREAPALIVSARFLAANTVDAPRRRRYLQAEAHIRDLAGVRCSPFT